MVPALLMEKGKDGSSYNQDTIQHKPCTFIEVLMQYMKKKMNTKKVHIFITFMETSSHKV